MLLRNANVSESNRGDENEEREAFDAECLTSLPSLLVDRLLGSGAKAPIAAPHIC